MSTVPHPIPYQGSKRRLAAIILEHCTGRVRTFYEPFAGSAATTLAAASRGVADSYVLGDSFVELASVLRMIIEEPERLADEYTDIWSAQHYDPRTYYDLVRERFNRDGGPSRLLFLLARCVKNAVRFNGNGEFNQSPDKRRLGTHPDRMRASILGASQLLRGKSRVLGVDYAELLALADPSDLVYMDPPYQGTSGDRDQRYREQLDLDRFVCQLESLVARKVPFIVSFDGRCGTRTYGPDLPLSLGLTRIEVHAGRSSQATLNGGDDETFESLYLSPGLAGSVRSLSRSVMETAQTTFPWL